MNTDRMFGTAAANPQRMRQSMYNMIVQTQDAPEVQVQAMAMALFLTCRALDIDIRRLLTTCERMANDLDSPFSSHFRALEAYAREQIGGYR